MSYNKCAMCESSEGQECSSDCPTMLQARVAELKAALDRMQRSRDRYRQAWEAEKVRARAVLNPSQEPA